jgi:CBS domain-containing protein
MIMTRMPNIVYTTDEENAFEAAGKLMLHEVDSLPVVEGFKNEEGKNLLRIIGKISKTNITKLLYDLCKQ